jgi:uncharacterized membrane protein YdjX (TVP38/TMEM64 family)
MAAMDTSAMSETDETTQPLAPDARRPIWKRLLPVAVLAALFAAFFVFDLDAYLSFQTLQDHRDTLKAMVAENAVLVGLAFILIYAAATAASVPGGLVLTVAGGFMFGTLQGAGYVVIGATLGATAIFLAARYAFGALLRAKAGGLADRVAREIESNAVSYLLLMRLVPAVPFFVANVAPAFTNVSLRIYMLTTFFGIMPGTVIYAQVGSGIDAVFARGESFSADSVLTWQNGLALSALILLSLFPIVFRKLTGRRPV